MTELLTTDAIGTPGGVDPSGSAGAVALLLGAHTGATGASVHGLGTASTHDESDFDPAGSAASVTCATIGALGLHETADNSAKLSGVTPGTQGLSLLQASTQEEALVSIGSVAASLATGGDYYHNSNGGISRVKELIIDPFRQYVTIRFVGDSITWGYGITGTSDPNPITGSLSDPRDGVTSNSWVNVIRNYYANKLSGSTNATPGVNPGEAYVEWSDGVFFDDALVSHKTASGVDVVDPYYESDLSYKFGRMMMLSGFPDNRGIEFDFYGDSFDLYYKQSASSHDYEVLYDTVSEGTFATSGSTVYGQKRTHALTLGQHHVRISLPSSTYADSVVLEGIVINRKLNIHNDGIIGATTKNWLPGASIGLLYGAVETTDDVVFVSLGTNNRSNTNVSTPAWLPGTVANDLNTICGWLASNGNVPVLMSTCPMYTDSFYLMDQRRIGYQVESLCESIGVDYVDGFSPSYKAYKMGNTVASVSTGHPNDLGALIMGRTVINAMESCPVKATSNPERANGVVFGSGDGATDRFRLPVRTSRVRAIYRETWAGVERMYPFLRTNVAIWSNDLSNVAHVKSNSGTGSLPTATYGSLGADGITNNASRVQANQGAGNAASDWSYVYSPAATTVPGMPYVASIWIKSNTGSNQSIFFNASHLAITSRSAGMTGYVASVTPTWRKFSIHGVADSSAISRIFVGVAGPYTPSGSVADVLVQFEQIVAGDVKSADILTTSAPASVTDYGIDSDLWVTLSPVPIAAATLTADLDYYPNLLSGSIWTNEDGNSVINGVELIPPSARSSVIPPETTLAIMNYATAVPASNQVPYAGGPSGLMGYVALNTGASAAYLKQAGGAAPVFSNIISSEVALTGYVAAGSGSISAADSVMIALQKAADLSSVQTLSNKRVTPRVQTEATGVSPAITPASDTADAVIHSNTSATGTITILNPSGTPSPFQKLMILVKSTNSQTLAWGAGYRGVDGAALMTALGAGKTYLVEFVRDSTNSTWDAIKTSTF